MSSEGPYETFSEPLYRERTQPLSDQAGHETKDGVGTPTQRKFPSLYPSSEASVVELSRTEAKQPSDKKPKHRLGVFVATAIAGNDILSSLLFVSALTAVEAGIWAPVAQVLVVFTLWLYKGVYCEVLSALPMNGGCFNVLLHTTSKGTASIAACFSILSYVATCVCSGTSAVYYLHEVAPSLDVISWTIALLCFFAFLNLMGISESGTVALIIFVVHTFTLLLLVLSATYWVMVNGLGTLGDNWSGNFAALEPTGEPMGPTYVQRGFWTSVFFGYGTAMLGVSGFESSSQFIEEQAKGVFPRTLDNMWFCIAFFNPIIMILALCVFPLPDIAVTHRSVLLSAMGKKVAGEWLHYVVSVDAFLVLAGAVLTAFVGVTGLVRRLALERCMPQWLLQTNSCRHTNHHIILGFLIICVSMFLLLNAQVEALSEMYSVCFLCLLLMFASGHMMMKIKRSQLPRSSVAPWWTVILAAIMVSIAFMAIVKKNPAVVGIWAMYFSVTCVLVGMMFFRMFILKLLLRAVRYVLIKLSGRRHPSLTPNIEGGEPSSGSVTSRGQEAAIGCVEWLNAKVKTWIKQTTTQPVVFFTKNGNAVAMNKAILYIRQNEDTQFIKIVHFAPSGKMDPAVKARLVADVQFLDRLYPKHCIDLVFVDEDFDAASVERLAAYYKIPNNRMFIACPSKGFKDTVATLGGVRVITH
uniref:Amino acid permease/ SLC12A domain-containing protein n=1 Tax=Lotharella globosa TaxID=91324 RepID=A0A7S3YJ83_9EUKA|mmetsp:Transcript_16285/g.33018  ORF Transcript_16285/g.33018 Transcript_16285/m.33018 type:complete len:696 (+) Transcript_16285:80-2167(+)